MIKVDYAFIFCSVAIMLLSIRKYTEINYLKYNMYLWIFVKWFVVFVLARHQVHFNCIFYKTTLYLNDVYVLFFYLRHLRSQMYLSSFTQTAVPNSAQILLSPTEFFYFLYKFTSVIANSIDTIIQLKRAHFEVPDCWKFPSFDTNLSMPELFVHIWCVRLVGICCTKFNRYLPFIDRYGFTVSNLCYKITSQFKAIVIKTGQRNVKCKEEVVWYILLWCFITFKRKERFWEYKHCPSCTPYSIRHQHTHTRSPQLFLHRSRLKHCKPISTLRCVCFAFIMHTILYQQPVFSTISFSLEKKPVSIGTSK